MCVWVFVCVRVCVCHCCWCVLFVLCVSCVCNCCSVCDVVGVCNCCWLGVCLFFWLQPSNDNVVLPLTLFQWKAISVT